MQAVFTLPAYQVPSHLRQYFQQHLCGSCYVCHLVEIFRAVRRVLRDDGTLWLNLGDSYAGSGQGWQKEGGSSIPRKWLDEYGYDKPPGYISSPQPSGLKPKDLVGIPWRVAFALQADGWWLRSDIIWHKPNCMPESVRDRPTKGHEYVFLLAKSKQYYYDQDAIREAHSPKTLEWAAETKSYSQVIKELGGDLTRRQPVSEKGQGFRHLGLHPAGRNRRTVWTIPTRPFPDAHFATFPEALVEPCIKAGTSERGACPACGRAWVRVVRRTGVNQSNEAGIKTMEAKGVPRQKANLYVTRDRGSTKTLGWRPACSCCDGLPGDVSIEMAGLAPIPQLVLDPFAGAGTVGLVAEKLGRDSVLIEIKPEYARMAQARILKELGEMFTQVEIENAPPTPDAAERARTATGAEKEEE